MLFEPSKWIPRLLSTAGFGAVPSVRRAQWSYEWAREWTSPEGEKRGCMCDVVVEFEDEEEEANVLVVEAKALDTGIGKKEANWHYYLGAPEIAAFGPRRHLLYLVDDTVRPEVLAQLGELPAYVRLITWQQLAGLQISLAIEAAAANPVFHYVAGAIQFQFVQHDIYPTQLSAEYLGAEPSIAEVDLGAAPKQSMADHYREFWRLADSA